MSIRRVKGNQIPHGTILATLIAAEGQCGSVGCDSWKTVGIDIDTMDEEGEKMVRYVICLKHLGEFMDDMFLKGSGILEADEDCGDPECPIHGDDADDYYDDEDYDD